MGINSAYTVGQPSKGRAIYPYKELESWIASRAWSWIDAENIAQSGGEITRFNDKSDFGNHDFSGAAGNRPTKEAGILNGRSGARFESVNTEFVSCSDNYQDMQAYNVNRGESLNQNDRDIFILFMGTGGHTSHSLIADSVSNVFDVSVLDTDGLATGIELAVRASVQNQDRNWKKITNYDGDNIPHLINVKSNNPEVPQEISARKDRAAGITYSDGARLWSDSGTSVINLGFTDAYGHYFNGWLFEMILFPEIISDEKTLEIETYLLDKWGII